MNEARIHYKSESGELSFILIDHKDLVKAFETIILMEQQRINQVKAEEKALQIAKKMIEERELLMNKKSDKK